MHLKEGEENNMEDKKGDLQSNGVLKQNLLLQTSKKIKRHYIISISCNNSYFINIIRNNNKQCIWG